MTYEGMYYKMVDNFLINNVDGQIELENYNEEWFHQIKNDIIETLYNHSLYGVVIKENDFNEILEMVKL